MKTVWDALRSPWKVLEFYSYLPVWFLFISLSYFSGMKKGSKLSLSPKMAKFWKPIMKLLNKHGLLTEFLPHLVSEITCKTSLRNSQLCAWILKLIPSKTHGIYIKDFDFDCPSFKKLLKNCVLLESPYATKLINKWVFLVHRNWESYQSVLSKALQEQDGHVIQLFPNRLLGIYWCGLSVIELFPCSAQLSWTFHST